jgi:hypothetical protein
MSEETTTNSTEQPAAETAEKAARPDFIDEKFWDQDAGQVRTEDLAKSYREAQSLIGRRVSDLSPDARRKLAESLPDEMRQTWEQDVRTRLAEDEEFLAPIKDALKPKAPETYDLATVELPEGLSLDTEHPVLAKAQEWARERGLGQEDFAQLLALGAELTAPPASIEDRMAAIGDDYGERAKALVNRARSVAGVDAEARAAIEAALAEMHSPEAFRGMEMLLAARGEKPAPLDGAGTKTPPLTVESLKEIQGREDYTQRRDLQEQVRKGYAQLFSETL